MGNNIDDYSLYQSNLIYGLRNIYGDEGFKQKLTVSASSHYPTEGEQEHRENIDTILDYSEGRWVSAKEDTPHFTIEFTEGSIFLQSYAFKWSANYRFNTMWKVEGYSNNIWKAIDIRDEPNMCYDFNSKTFCQHEIFKIFAIETPASFSKLRVKLVGLDICSDSILSLTQIMLFGQYNPRITNKEASTRISS